MLTSAIRDLHCCNPGRFLTDIRTNFPELWLNNPHITRLLESDADVLNIECHYPLIHSSNSKPYHFIHGFHRYLSRKLGVHIEPTLFHGDIYLYETERTMPSQVAQFIGEEAPFWLVAAGGKYDFTIKWWETTRWQKIVDYFRGRIFFVQVGRADDHHPKLSNVLDFRGQTTLRDLIRLVFHAQGVLCPVTCLMHLAAAVPVKEFDRSDCKLKGRRQLRPCVVVAGGREPPHWEAYPGHQFIHTVGVLPCCAHGGCWKSRTLPLGDGDSNDHPSRLCTDVVNNLPRCMYMITPEDVIRRIEFFFEGGACSYLGNDCDHDSSSQPSPDNVRAVYERMSR